MPYREEIAVDKGIDHTLAFLKEGYLYISNRTKRYNRNMFATRLLGGKRIICMVGKEAAEVFYDKNKFIRNGAAPSRVLKTLFGENGVQTLDGPTHHHRKELFMSFMTAERLANIRVIMQNEWGKNISYWPKKKSIILYEEAKKVMTKTACIWAGVPLQEKNEKEMTSILSSLYEAGGAIGIRHWQGRINRQKSERELAKLITAVRHGRLEIPQNTPLYMIAFFRNLKKNELLDPSIAAVELLNILRPIVATGVYITFAALALHSFPIAKERLVNGSKKDYHMFVQEVRRYYPFFPMAIAKVYDDFIWYGHEFKKDTLVLLDIYGTNHHPDLWKNPNEFRPERFKNWDKNPFDFIPQGGGDYYNNHRCPGEWLTVDIVHATLEILVNQIQYQIPKQKLAYSMTQMPSIPKSGLVMTDINIQSL